MFTKKTPTLELEIAEEVGRLLCRFGEVSLAYVTAELSPFSDQFKPDIIFVPRTGPKAGATHFVEFRVARERPLLERSSKILPLHRDFASEGEGASFHYAFATDEKVPFATEELLATQDIKVFAGFTSPQLLAADIAVWAEVVE